jgi:hypothetical protein
MAEKSSLKMGASPSGRIRIGSIKVDRGWIETMEAKVKSKNEVFSELTEEHVSPKRVLGRFSGHLGASGHPGYLD